MLLKFREGNITQLKRRLGVRGIDDSIRVFEFLWISFVDFDLHKCLARVLSLQKQLLRR